MVVQIYLKKEISFLEKYIKAHQREHNNCKESQELEKYNTKNRLSMDNMEAKDHKLMLTLEKSSLFIEVRIVNKMSESNYKFKI
jgi:hypothetical protein